MRPSRWIAIFVGIVLTIFLGYRWFESSLAADRQKAITDSLSDFRQHQSQYDALIPVWRSVYKSSDPCGLPAPAQGMVQLHIFALKEDGGYRVTADGKDEVFPSIQSAASALSVEPTNLESLKDGLRSLNRSAVYQHEAEVKVPAGANYGVLFVPSGCPQASRYRAESQPGAISSFVNLIALGGGWYYYAERR